MKKCKLTKAQRAKKWRKENPEKEMARTSNWLKANPGRKAAADAKWQSKNREKCRAYHRKSNAKSRKHRRAFLDEEKSKPCTDCGNRFPPCCMDFDHRPGTKKRRGVGEMTGGSINALKLEISKCDLVCANCHRIRTKNRLQHRKVT